MAHMVPGRPVPVSLPSHVSWVLTKADILVAGDYETRRRGEWLHYRTFRAADFRNGFVVVPNLVPAFHIGAMRRYYRFKFEPAALNSAMGRSAAATRPTTSRLRDMCMNNWHKRCELAAATMKPSYAYS
jgi:hypothetical protein